MRAEHRHARDPRAYLLVYHVDSSKPGDVWFDQGNDPEMRQPPMSWGICRTNVRGWVRAGDRLFFLGDRGGKAGEERYFLTGLLAVGDLIGHDVARSRFKRRPNVIVDTLPAGADVRAQVERYVGRHRADLQWTGVKDLAGGFNGWKPEDFTVVIGGKRYVHSWWDVHDDWKDRLKSPYVVGAEGSKVLGRGVSYRKLSDASPTLPKPNELINAYNRHAARRLWNPDDVEMLLKVIARESEHTPVEGVLPLFAGRC